MNKENIIAYFKAAFFKLGNQYLTKAIVKILSKVGLGLSGPVGWIASWFVEFVLKKGWEWISKFLKKKEVEEKVKKEATNYDQKINDPNATEKDIKDAGKDFLTG